MKLHNIGEFGLIERIAKGIRTDASVVRGIGDDAAVIKWTKDTYLLATADMLIEDRHFRRARAPEKIGWKAVCCGISDIAAMGGVPKWMLCSYGFPKDLSVKYVDGIYSGIKQAAKKFGVNIIGGDTNSSGKMVLDVTVLGEVKKGNLVLRSGAKVGDFIFVTGSLGGSIYGRHLTFTPRLKESQILVKTFKLNSMIDLSDGLSGDLNHILKQSGVGAVVYEYLIPLSAARSGTAPYTISDRRDFPVPPAGRDKNVPAIQMCRGRSPNGPTYVSIENALSDGEDFELLFTMSTKEAFRLFDLRRRLFNIPVTRIGTITDKKFGARIVDIFGRKRDLRPTGFRHF